MSYEQGERARWKIGPYLKSGRGQRNANVRPGPEPRGFLKFIIKSHKTKMLPAQSAHRNKTKRSRRKAHGNKSTEYHISDLTLRTPYIARDNMCRGVYPRHLVLCSYSGSNYCGCLRQNPQGPSPHKGFRQYFDTLARSLAHSLLSLIHI